MAPTASHKPSRIFKCPRCPSVFTRMFNLKAHLRSHLNERPYACEICEHRFTRKNDLKNHRLQTHAGAKEFPCSICGRLFKRRQNQIRHQRSCKNQHGEVQGQTSDDNQLDHTPRDEASEITVSAHPCTSSSKAPNTNEIDLPDIGEALPIMSITRPLSPSEAELHSDDDDSSDVENGSTSILYRNGVEIPLHFIRTTMRLDILQFAIGESNDSSREYPTWACGPNGFTPVHPTMTLILTGCNACGDRTKIDPVPSRFSPFLKIRGVIFDVIGDISSCFRMNFWERPPPSIPVADSWTSFFQADVTYITGEPLAAVLAFVLSDPLKDNEILKDAYPNPRFLKYAAGAFSAWLDMPYVHPLSQTNTHYRTIASEADVAERQKWDRRFRLINYLTFFTTLRGYLGSQTRNGRKVRRGDVCCVLFGCAAPLILRPVEDHFHLVGAVYIHGAMKGEIIDQLKAGELKEQLIEIR